MDNKETILESILENQDERLEESNDLLEKILEQTSDNNTEDILDKQLEIQAETLDVTKKIAETVNGGMFNGVELIALKGKDSKPEEVALILRKDTEFIDSLKGKDGETPTVEKLVKIIKPLIPEVKDGETPSDEKLISLIEPLIPEPIKGKDGENVDKDEVVAEVLSKIPKNKTIKYNPDTPNQIKEKLLKVGLYFNEIKDIPNIEEDLKTVYENLNKVASKTVSLVELDDVDYSGLTYINGKYILGSGGGGGTVTTNSSLTGDGSGGSPLGINYAHAGTYTASQTFLQDTIFSDVAPLNGHELKLVSYLKDDVLYDASWTLGHGNTLSVPDTNQVIIGNNNSMTGFLGFINGIGNTSTGTEDVFINGMNNIVTGTSGGAVSGISNTLTDGSSVYVQGISNSTGAFSNQLISGLSCTTSNDNTVALGLNLVNSLTNSLDIGMSDASKTTLTTTYARFRTDVGIGTIPSAGLHILKTTEQFRLSYDASNDVRFTVSSGGLLSLQTTAGATAGVYTLTPHGSGGAGTNRTLNFGAAWGNAALWLYNNGAGTRFGWGMQADAMQFFAPTTTGGIFSWNRGGDLQASGTNELMRLTQYATRAGLGIGCGATSPHIFEGRLISDASASVSTEDFFRVHRQVTGGVSYPQAFSMSLGRYVAPSTFSPNSSVDIRLKSTSTNDITTDAGVMSLNSNKRVLIGANGAASATLHLIGTTEQFRSSYDASNYWNATTSSAGAVTFDAVGASASFTFSDVIRATDGSAASPAYSFSTSTNTGIYLGASNILYIAQAGNNIMRFSNSAMLAYKNITGLDTKTFNLNAAAGSATVPSYSFNTDANTGMWSSGADTLNLTTGGTDRLTLTTTEVTFADSFNIAFNTTTGTKIGTSTSQKLGIWGATPIVQPTTAISASTFVANTSGIANDTATFDGYTIGQVVKALRNTGLLA